MFYIQCWNFLASLAFRSAANSLRWQYYMIFFWVFLRAWLSLTARVVHLLHSRLYTYSISCTIAQTREICKYPIQDRHIKDDFFFYQNMRRLKSELYLRSMLKTNFGLRRIACTFLLAFFGWRVFFSSPLITFQTFQMMWTIRQN